jgi:pimeloyl-ACP methyl ester carboxylesterase
VVFLHGNSASRLSGYRILKNVLLLDVDLLCFDFSGSGLSEGDYVTLGLNESRDVLAVVRELRARGVSEIVLWGRSMGAVTALLFAQMFHQPEVRALVLDSPFASFRDLVDDLLANYAPMLPSFLVEFVFRQVAETVLQETGLDIYTHSALQGMAQCSCPALFIAGVQDALIPSSHS